MTQTHDETEGAGDPGPQVNREQVHDLDQLRRSSTDRFVAGVAGGLGRHFGVDPTVIRVVLAALCLFGGAGLLLYVGFWLFVPEEGRDRAPIHLTGETRRVVLIAIAAVAAIAFVGNSWGGFGWGGFGWHVAWPLLVVAVIAALVTGGARRRGERADAAASYVAPGAPAPGSSASFTAGTSAGSSTGAGMTGDPAAPVPPAPQPPAYVPPPPRPARTGVVLFWPTLALIALGLGILGIYDINHHVAAGAWAATALAIIGVMLVVGAFVGRPGGLILLGLLTIPPLAVSSVVGSAHWEDHTVRYQPATAAQVDDSYSISNGRLVLDLSRVSDPRDLAGRNIALHVNAGEIKVIVPRSVVDTAATGSLGFAGDVEIGTREQSGFHPSLQRTLIRALPPRGAPVALTPLEIDAHGRVGHIQIGRF